MIRQTLKSADITAEIVIFGVYTIDSYYGPLLNYKNYICSRVNITSLGCTNSF